MRQSNASSASKQADDRLLPDSVDVLHSLIAEQQEQLSARLKLVAVYLVEHPQQVAFSTLAEIAKAAGVHASTLVRFANHFGFGGFSELQRLYKNQLLQHPGNYRERISQLKKAGVESADSSPDHLLHEFIDGNQLALSLLQEQISPELLDATVETLQLPHPALSMWESRLSSTPDNVYGYVALIDDEIVGNLGFMVCVNQRRRHVASIGMGVKDNFAGQGVGSALLATAIDLADNWLNLIRIELTVFVDNEPAINLYKKFGFEVEGESPAYAFRSGEYVSTYHMARVIGLKH